MKGGFRTDQQQKSLQKVTKLAEKCENVTKTDRKDVTAENDNYRFKTK